MLRLVRRAVPVGLLLAVALQGGALAATTTVTMTNFQFTPKTPSIAVGSTVHWTNSTTTTSHTSTGDSPLSLWDSGTVAGGHTFDFTFTAAGTYTYHCTFHQSLGMVGTISVTPTASPTSGAAGTVFHIQWATVTAPTGFVYDIQITPPGGTAITKMNLTAKGIGLTLNKTGTWKFASRLRKTADNSASGFSPAVSVTVT